MKAEAPPSGGALPLSWKNEHSHALLLTTLKFRPLHSSYYTLLLHQVRCCKLLVSTRYIPVYRYIIMYVAS